MEQISSSTLITVLGGVGLFLLGMSVMTNGLKALAGVKLRATLSKAAATPLSGTFWGAFITLIVQSSSATTMTTIGLVSAGLLTFSQGLALVFGANIGTTGTAWLIALIGVRVSLTATAMPMVFTGALLTLLGKGRLSAAGSALAGFALILIGLTSLQQGMEGVADRLHPANLPAVLGTGAWWSNLLGVLTLVASGLAMTAVMQSSTAAVAVTLSAYFAGAVGLDQACALIIGQNIGTATSSAMAAIGASSTAKRLALAYVLFKLIAATIALTLFPLTTPILVRLSNNIDGVTLLAAYHTAFNVVGVSVMLPLIDKFTRFVERILPERASPLTQCLDRAALTLPLATEEAVRRTVARSFGALCGSIGTAVTSGASISAVAMVNDALRQAREFMSDASGPPESEREKIRLTHTLYALDYVARLAEEANEINEELWQKPRGPEDLHAKQLCADAMQYALVIANETGALPAADERAEKNKDTSASDAATLQTLLRIEHCARSLRELHEVHRQSMLTSVAGGAVNADHALAHVDTIRRLEALAYNAWRSAAYLVNKLDSGTK
ncbi:MAG: Na/Pi symporter [Pseudomonadales bacterium]|jgi:phosphate:Na+ symporter|nr:Na/Pi symporter [Pseudomonadales bacterium]